MLKKEQKCVVSEKNYRDYTEMYELHSKIAYFHNYFEKAEEIKRKAFYLVENKTDEKSLDLRIQCSGMYFFFGQYQAAS